MIGYVGRLVPEKGVDLLIRALARDRRDVAAWSDRAGAGARPNLQRLAASLNLRTRIAFTGQVPSTRMPAFYRELEC